MLVCFHLYNDFSGRPIVLRMVLEGLKPESNYTIGIIAWDSAGNPSGTGSVETNQLFMTTDNVPPLMPNRLWFRSDSTDPSAARLDSNRIFIYWARSADPLSDTSGIVADSILHYPASCYEGVCFRHVKSYEIHLWKGSD